MGGVLASLASWLKIRGFRWERDVCEHVRLLLSESLDRYAGFLSFQQSHQHVTRQ